MTSVLQQELAQLHLVEVREGPLAAEHPFPEQPEQARHGEVEQLCHPPRGIVVDEVMVAMACRRLRGKLLQRPFDDIVLRSRGCIAASPSDSIIESAM